MRHAKAQDVRARNVFHPATCAAGIGKSATATQAARELGLPLIRLNLSSRCVCVMCDVRSGV